MNPPSTAAATAAYPPHNERRSGRSRSTNNPSFLPKRPLSPFQSARRQRDLVDAFVKALGGSVTELVAVQVRKCAELLTMAEGIRAGALGGTPQTSGDLMALIRIEGEARRCLKTLGIKIEPAPKPSGGLTIARQRWAEEAAKKAAGKLKEPTTAHITEPPDGPAPRNDDDRSQARSEAAALLGIDIANPSPADSLRIDMVSSLRLVIDHEQASVLSGSSADLGKLNIAVQSLIALLPGRELPSPSDNHPDPREVMWEIYKQMRERGEIGLKALPEGGADARIAELEAEIVELKELLAGKTLPLAGKTLEHPGANVAHVQLSDVTAITPAESDITPPGELGLDCHAGIRPAADDPPPKSTRVIEAKAVPAAAPAPEPWQEWIDAGGYGGPGYDRWSDNRR